VTDENAPVRKHLASAKERAAGSRAAQAWHQELAAEHLLRSQQPISSEPVTPTVEPPAK
jgi:hypothetical protein